MQIRITIRIIFSWCLLSITALLFLLYSEKTFAVNADSLHIELALHTESDTTRVNLLNMLADEYSHVQPDSSFEFANEVKQISEEINFAKGSMRSLSLLGYCYYINS